MTLPDNEHEDLEKWLAPLSPLELDEFCQRWIPIIYNITYENRRYSRISIYLISKLTNKAEKTVINWFCRPQTVPANVKDYLGAVDALWRISIIINGTAAHPEKPDD